MRSWIWTLAVFASLAWFACSSVVQERRLPGPPPASDQDLVGILPAASEGVFDLDLVGMRRLPLGEALWRHLPDSAQRALLLFSAQPLQDLDAVAVAVSNLGTDKLETVLAVRGTLDAAAIRARFLGEEPQAATFHYHGQELLEVPGRTLGWLSARAAVVGGRSAVRQVIDNLHDQGPGEGSGARSQRDLAAALDRTPRARDGRPALWFALLPSTALRGSLRQADLAELGADAAFVAGALALGDGLDLGLVAGFRELPQAQDVAQRLTDRVERLRRRPALQKAGLARHLRAVVIKAVPLGLRRTMPEVHLAYRLAEADAEDFLQRLAELRGLLKEALPHQKAP